MFQGHLRGAGAPGPHPAAPRAADTRVPCRERGRPEEPLPPPRDGGTDAAGPCPPARRRPTKSRPEVYPGELQPPQSLRPRRRAAGAECPRAAPCPYLEMLEEGGDAGDLQAQAPGGASGAGERLVLPAGGGGTRAGRAAADGRHPEEQGEGRAGRPPHHRSAGGEGRKAAGHCGLSCCSPGGCRAVLGADGSAHSAETKQESSIIQLSSPPSLPPLGPQPSPARRRAGRG